MSEVIIMAGIPGSGKTTYANDRHPDHLTYSTDDYWMCNGEYIFDPKRIGDAHAWNLRMYTTQLVRNESACIVVDNTNLSVAEIAPYYALASAYGYRAQIEHIICDVDVAIARQTHGVPTDSIVRMFESSAKLAGSLPPWWNYSARSPR